MLVGVHGYYLYGIASSNLAHPDIVRADLSLTLVAGILGECGHDYIVLTTTRIMTILVAHLDECRNDYIQKWTWTLRKSPAIALSEKQVRFLPRCHFIYLSSGHLYN